MFLITAAGLKSTRVRVMLWAGLGVIALAALSGCMSDPHEGDLPWAPTATWEGTPALPGGMMNP